MKTILVADVPQMDGRYSAALAGWGLVFARTMAEARHALGAAHPALVAIGVYFDDSRMFDLVRTLRGDDAYRGVPIVCVRGRPGFTAVTTRTLELTLKALTVDEFIDLVHFGEDDSGNAALRAAVERLLRR
jgi:response regulator of citrate/malate metabolism